MERLNEFHLDDRLVLTVQTREKTLSVSLSIDDALGLCMSLAYQVREKLNPQDKFPCEFVRKEKNGG